MKIKKSILTGFIAAIVVALIGFGVMYWMTMSRLSKPAQFDAAGSENAVIRKDITYKTVAGKPLSLDIYLPEKKQDKYPVMFLVQGNGPGYLTKNAKDWGIFVSYGKILSTYGIATVVANRRESVDYETIDQSKSDIADMWRFLEDHHAEYHLDMNRKGVWAFSAGGAYLSLAMSQPEKYKCLVSFYGMLDLQTFRSNISKKLSDNDIQLHSPIFYLNKDFPNLPILVVTAANDSLKPIIQSNSEFVAKAKSMDLNIKQIVHESGGHGFDGLEDSLRTREIIGETLRFIGANL